MHELKLDRWQRHDWQLRHQNVTVLHSEPFRWSWFATTLVTYVFVIHETPDSYASLMNDYTSLRDFARNHKQTRLPFSLQSGLAILPIYIGDDFDADLIKHVESTYRKRWCVIHIPSLYDRQTNAFYTLDDNYLWGGAYRDFVSAAIHRVALQLKPPLTIA